MEHSRCHDMLGTLSDYVDGDLRQELCAELERHLSECDNCRVVVDTLRKTIYLYQAASDAPALPDEVRYRLYHRLELDDLLPTSE